MVSSLGTEEPHIYGGLFGDILTFSQDARNCSFTFLTPEDQQWGFCNGINNCTRMIGMVNRNEVDFAIPTFVDTKDRRQNVDFSEPQLSSH